VQKKRCAYKSAGNREFSIGRDFGRFGAGKSRLALREPSELIDDSEAKPRFAAFICEI
jgi:hypothetical protein